MRRNKILLQDEFQTVRRRLRVRPGMTGLWQVSGRNDLSPEDSIRLDLYYIDNWSMWLDMRIILLTVFSNKAYRNAI